MQEPIECRHVMRPPIQSPSVSRVDSILELSHKPLFLATSEQDNVQTNTESVQRISIVYSKVRVN